MRFSQKRKKMRAEARTKKFEEPTVKDKCLAEIHRVRTNLEDPVVVKSEPKQGNCPQVFSFSSFLFELELPFLFSFEKT